MARDGSFLRRINVIILVTWYSSKMLQGAALLFPTKFSPYILSVRILSEYWIICVTIVAAACFMRRHKGFGKANAHKTTTIAHEHSVSQSSSSHRNFRRGNLRDTSIGRRRPSIDSALHSANLADAMPYPHNVGLSKKAAITTPVALQSPTKVRQPYEAFLILDVEATCHRGTDFNFPNEIIVSERRSFCAMWSG